MKRFFCCLFLTCLILFSSSLFVTFAATKADVVRALNATYSVANGKSFRLPKKYIALGEEYLNEKPLSSKQYDSILGYISQAVALAREIGHTDFDRYSEADKKRAIRILYEASLVADVDLDKELSENKIDLKNEMSGANNTGSSKNDGSSSSGNVSNNVKPSGKPVSESSGNLGTKSDSGTSDESFFVGELDVSEAVNGDGIVDISGDILESSVSGDGSVFDDGLSDEGEEGGALDEFRELFTKVDKKVDNVIIFFYIAIVVIFLVLILIFDLILKKIKGKIIKYLLLSIVLLLMLSLLLVLGLSIWFSTELRFVIKLYFISM